MPLRLPVALVAIDNLAHELTDRERRIAAAPRELWRRTGLAEMARRHSLGIGRFHWSPRAIQHDGIQHNAILNSEQRSF